jgi:hypothetical protein
MRDEHQYLQGRIQGPGIAQAATCRRLCALVVILIAIVKKVWTGRGCRRAPSFELFYFDDRAANAQEGPPHPRAAGSRRHPHSAGAGGCANMPLPPRSAG